jgi:uncharacterized membrane protein
MRRRYIDCARGIAVLLMIEAHTTDAWTRAASKSSVAFRNATILGGFAAPLFLWLAGLGVVLAATRLSEQSGRPAAVAAACRRGLEIFILAYLFRLQAFIISPGSPPIALFRIDILNIMGPAIVLAGIMWGFGATTARRVLIYGVAAVATAMVTPVVRAAAWTDALPVLVQWYLRPAGEYTTFTAFPWIGFVFAGAAVGALLAAAQDDRTERRIQMLLSLAGAALIVLGLFAATRPTIYHASAFWTSSPTWFSIRAGVMMIALAAVYAMSRIRRGVMSAWQDPLAQMGRGSLFVYWIHVELVYGYASWLWRGRLPLWGTAAAALLFTALMYYAVVVRDRVVQTRKMRGGQPVTVQPANA